MSNVLSFFHVHVVNHVGVSVMYKAPEQSAKVSFGVHCIFRRLSELGLHAGNRFMEIIIVYHDDNT